MHISFMIVAIKVQTGLNHCCISCAISKFQLFIIDKITKCNETLGTGYRPGC